MVRHCIRRQCFILLPDAWVVFKMYFAILHKIVAINNVQQRITLNKQKEKKFSLFALLLVSHVTHPGHLLLAYGRMERSNMRKVCGNIFEACNVQLYLNVHQRFSQIFRLYDDIYIGICRIF